MNKNNLSKITHIDITYLISLFITDTVIQYYITPIKD